MTDVNSARAKAERRARRMANQERGDFRVVPRSAERRPALTVTMPAL